MSDEEQKYKLVESSVESGDLSDALDLASGIEVEYDCGDVYSTYRDDAYALIARAMAKNGQITEALEIADSAFKEDGEDDEPLDSIVKESIVEALVETGSFFRALDVAEKIECEDKEYRALESIIARILDNSQPEQTAQAFCRILEIPRWFSRPTVMALCARGLAQLGKDDQAALFFSRALEIANNIEITEGSNGAAEKLNVYQIIAESLSQFTQKELSARLLWQVLQQTEITNITWEKSKTLGSIARAFAEIGFLPHAMHVFWRIGALYDAIAPFEGIARALSELAKRDQTSPFFSWLFEITARFADTQRTRALEIVAETWGLDVEEARAFSLLLEIQGARLDKSWGFLASLDFGEAEPRHHLSWLRGFRMLRSQRLDIARKLVANLVLSYIRSGNFSLVRKIAEHSPEFGLAGILWPEQRSDTPSSTTHFKKDWPIEEREEHPGGNEVPLEFEIQLCGKFSDQKFTPACALHLSNDALRYAAYQIFHETAGAEFRNHKNIQIPLDSLLGIADESLRLTTFQVLRIQGYDIFRIPKRRKGFRVIHSPRVGLAHIQRRIKERILDPFPGLPDCVTAFRPGVSIRDNALIHCGKAVVVKFDLEDFFPSVSFTRVMAIFHSLGFPTGEARMLANLTTVHLDESTVGPVVKSVSRSAEEFHRRKDREDALREYHGMAHSSDYQTLRKKISLALDPTRVVKRRRRGLPQGASTSPQLANLAAVKLDLRLRALGEAMGFAYTRYADDLTFSSTERLAKVDALVSLVDVIVEDCGFRLNERKTKIMRAPSTRRVTGLIVNTTTPKVPRSMLRKVRAMLHQHAGGKLSEADVHRLRGYLSFVRMINQEQADALLNGS